MLRKKITKQLLSDSSLQMFFDAHHKVKSINLSQVNLSFFAINVVIKSSGSQLHIEHLLKF